MIRREGDWFRYVVGQPLSPSRVLNIYAHNTGARSASSRPTQIDKNTTRRYNNWSHDYQKPTWIVKISRDLNLSFFLRAIGGTDSARFNSPKPLAATNGSKLKANGITPCGFITTTKNVSDKSQTQYSLELTHCSI